MLVGMGTVFVFLTVLVFAMSAMSAVVARVQPAASVPTATGATDEEVAAIATAIAVHRHRRQ